MGLLRHFDQLPLSISLQSHVTAYVFESPSGGFIHLAGGLLLRLITSTVITLQSHWVFVGAEFFPPAVIYSHTNNETDQLSSGSFLTY